MFHAKLYLELIDGGVLSELTAGYDRPFTVEQEEVLDDAIIRFVIDTRDEQATFRERLMAAPEVDAVEAIDESRLIVTKRARGALPIIRNNHGMLHGLDHVHGAQRVFDIIVFRRADLQRIVHELQEIGSVRLGKLVPHKAPTTALSKRQVEVVTLALNEGYFEWPRETDAETLAAELGIAHSTFLEHLRKAEYTLLKDALNWGHPSSASLSKEGAPLSDL